MATAVTDEASFVDWPWKMSAPRSRAKETGTPAKLSTV
jgi:hypothetical protein